MLISFLAPFLKYWLLEALNWIWFDCQFQSIQVLQSRPNPFLLAEPVHFCFIASRLSILRSKTDMVFETLFSNITHLMFFFFASLTTGASWIHDKSCYQCCSVKRLATQDVSSGKPLTHTAFKNCTTTDSNATLQHSGRKPLAFSQGTATTRINSESR